MIYLAVPYSHPDPAVRQQRFEAANKAASKLMKAGDHVFSPISHSHPIALAGGLPLDWDYWKAYDEHMLRACSKMVVLMLDGWGMSAGIDAEIKLANDLGIPVVFRAVTRNGETE